MKLFPFPKPKYVRKGDWDYSTHIIRWMGRNGLRELNRRHVAGEAIPTHEELAAWLLAIALERGSRWFTDSAKPGPYAKESAKVPGMAFDAATYTLEKWTPEFLARAARGGAAVGRGATFTVADLDRVPGLSIKKQAAALGCSEATVSTLRARAQARSTLTTQQDDLLRALLEPDHEGQASEENQPSVVDDADSGVSRDMETTTASAPPTTPFWTPPEVPWSALEDLLDLPDTQPESTPPAVFVPYVREEPEPDEADVQLMSLFVKSLAREA